MAAFDPATVQLQRDALTKTERDLDRDRRLLDKQPRGSRSKMAQMLRNRITEGERVARDLEWLLDLMQRLIDQARRHAAERAAVEQVAHADADSVLSHTPLAVAFGDAPAAAVSSDEDGEPA